MEVASMNPVERALTQDLTGLLDRLAASLPEGGFEGIRAAHPGLKGKLDDADARLAAARESLLAGYGRWRRALEDLENLWALGAWRSAAAEEPAEQSTALAACFDARGRIGGAGSLESLPVVRQLPGQADVRAEQPVHLVARGLFGRRHFASLCLVEAGRDRRL